ncbi:MAG: hypothetical protein QG608_3492 [Actinomycetota bacterium]|nr:hypothetical protein [Actinomycetota bacterium]
MGTMENDDKRIPLTDCSSQEHCTGCPGSAQHPESSEHFTGKDSSTFLQPGAPEGTDQLSLLMDLVHIGIERTQAARLPTISSTSPSRTDPEQCSQETAHGEVPHGTRSP